MRVKHVFEHYPRPGQPSGLFKFCPFCGTPLIVMESDYLPRPACSNCGFVQHRNPAPTVSVLVVDEDRVLLGKRGGHPGKGTWSLPSGYVEYEEDFLAIRFDSLNRAELQDYAPRCVYTTCGGFYEKTFNHFLHRCSRPHRLQRLIH